MTPHETSMVAGTVTASAIAFTATNVDDLVVLTTLFSQSGARADHRMKVVIGQFLGFSALIGISMLGFFGGMFLPGKWLPLLGFVPIVIGVRRWTQRHELQTASRLTAISIGEVTAVTFANGGDNIGIYSPLFASCTTASLMVMLLTFYLLLTLWCFAGHAISTHPTVAGALSRYGHIIVPFILVGLGVYILAGTTAHRLAASS